MVSPREVRQFLDDNPDLEGGLRDLLDAEDPFEFHDVDLDSGTFGELVSTDLVTQSPEGDGYELADRESITRALEGDVPEAEADETNFQLDFDFSDLDWRPIGFLTLGLLFVGLMRTVFSFSNVFQNGDIVLSSNDPYYYRYLVEELLANPDATLSALPGNIAHGEPLYVASMWFVSNVLGGSDQVVGYVLAWYPVIFAILTAFLLYVLAMQVTDDRRIALAAVLFLAILPGHAMRTSLGFADHHGFDYPWLAVTAVSLLAIVKHNFNSRRSLLAIAGLALGVTGQTLAWEAGPLLTAPVGLATLVIGLLWLHQGKSPLRNGVPFIAGLGIAGATTWAAHSTLGWHSTTVAISPVLLFLGSTGVLVVAEVIHRIDESIVVGIAAEFIVAVAGLFVLKTQVPEFWQEAISQINRKLFRTDAIAETQSLFGNSVAWLLLFGFILVVGFPYIVWFTYRLKEELIWAVPVVYAWWLFLLSAIQIRFVGEFGFIAAFFAAIAFVHMLAWLDATRTPVPFDTAVDGHSFAIPSRKTMVSIGMVFLLIGGLSILQVPVKTSHLTTPTDEYEVASWMAEYSEDQDLEYPENYVFSKWGDSRMYNYFVNGESQSYGFARNNYVDFLESTDPAAWHDRLKDRTGFIVTTHLTDEAAEETVYAKLQLNDAEDLPGYEKVYETEDGSMKVFILTERGEETTS